MWESSDPLEAHEEFFVSTGEHPAHLLFPRVKVASLTVQADTRRGAIQATSQRYSSRLMGFLSRTFVPRKVRRAAHPVRTAKQATKRAVIPKPVRKSISSAKKVAHPVGTVQMKVEDTAVKAAK